MLNDIWFEFNKLGNEWKSNVLLEVLPLIKLAFNLNVSDWMD